MKLSEAYANGFIDKELYDVINLGYEGGICKCGTPIEITYDLNWIYCSNGECEYTLASRLHKILELNFNSKVTYEDCLKEVKENKGKTLADILKGIANYSKLGADISTLRNISIQDIITSSGLLGYRFTEEVLKNENSMLDFYKKLKKNEVAFIAEKLGCNGEDWVLAVSVYNLAIQHKAEIIALDNMLSTI